jgi:transposase InsO family protein
MGIRDKLIAPASPWQNGFAERLIGSIRRECVDHIVVWGEGHLRRILRALLAITTTSERAVHRTKMRRPFSLFSESESSRHVRFLTGFITATVGFEFSVHTARPRRDGRRELIQLYHRARSGRRAGAW